jgi:hypothetical protein
MTDWGMEEDVRDDDTEEGVQEEDDDGHEDMKGTYQET